MEKTVFNTNTKAFISLLIGLTISLPCQSKDSPATGLSVPSSINNSSSKVNSPSADWSFFIYMQARNNLSPFAAKNLNAIAAFKSNPNINFIVQWDQPKQKGAWRYRIEKGQVHLEHYSDVKDPSDQAQKLVDFVKWGNENFPAKRNCLILWNHGVGPLNPAYGNPVRMMLSQRNESICVSPEKYIFLEPHEVLTSEEELEKLTKGGRGVLFDEDNKTYMTNDDLSRALCKITSKEVLGRKIDCLGFDACYMGSIEIATEVHKYADFMIASQELELARGWNYEKISEKVNGLSPSAAQLSKIIVSTFGDLYRGNTNIFTQSAIRLNNTDRLTRDLDQVVDAIEAAAREDKNFMIDAIRHARKNCLQFTAKVYVDLQSFYQNLLDKISVKTTQASEPTTAPKISHFRQRKAIGPSTKASQQKAKGNYNALADALRNGIVGLSTAVVENSCSNYLARAKGISIYFPMKFVDPSYEASKFAKNTKWLNFIRAFSMR